MRVLGSRSARSRLCGFRYCGRLLGIQPESLGRGAGRATIVREAGGVITNYDGAPWSLYDRKVVASNGQPGFHEMLLTGIHKARQTLADAG